MFILILLINNNIFLQSIDNIRLNVSNYNMFIVHYKWDIAQYVLDSKITQVTVVWLNNLY